MGIAQSRFGKDYKAPTPLSAQDQFYNQAVAKNKRSKYVLIAKIVIFTVSLLLLIFTLRSHYADAINVFGTLGWQLAVCHSYPILSPFMFSNRNTANTIMAVYYGFLSGGFVLARGWEQGTYDFIAPTVQGSAGSDLSWRDNTSTLIYYMETDTSYGLQDAVKWLTDNDIIETPSEGFMGVMKSAINGFAQYGLPILMGLQMIGGMFAV